MLKARLQQFHQTEDEFYEFGGEVAPLLRTGSPAATLAQTGSRYPALEAWGRARSIALRIIAPDDLNDASVCRFRSSGVQRRAMLFLSAVG